MLTTPYIVEGMNMWIFTTTLPLQFNLVVLITGLNITMYLYFPQKHCAMRLCKVQVNNPCTDLDRPVRFQDFEVHRVSRNRHKKTVR